MNTYIALFRGINVGGNNILPMQPLRTLLENLGFKNVKTYIQSGNVILQTEKKGASTISDMISIKIEEEYGFKPRIFLLNSEELKNAMDANPFPDAETDASKLHLNFLAFAPSDPDLEKLEEIKKGSEEYKLTDQVFYLYAPEGIGRSKLAANVEKALGVSLTSRNWRTVQKIMDMMESVI